MNIENIRLLAELMGSAGLTKLEIVEGDTKILLERAVSRALCEDAGTKPTEPSFKEQSGGGSAALDFNHIIEVKSPIVGVFYAAPSPDSAPFVTVGSRVKRGDVLCIVEAMKLMNEIVAERDGEIADICIKSGEIAEYGQVLFKMF